MTGAGQTRRGPHPPPPPTPARDTSRVLLFCPAATPPRWRCVAISHAAMVAFATSACPVGVRARSRCLCFLALPCIPCTHYRAIHMIPPHTEQVGAPALPRCHHHLPPYPPPHNPLKEKVPSPTHTDDTPSHSYHLPQFRFPQTTPPFCHLYSSPLTPTCSLPIALPILYPCLCPRTPHSHTPVGARWGLTPYLSPTPVFFFFTALSRTFVRRQKPTATQWTRACCCIVEHEGRHGGGRGARTHCPCRSPFLILLYSPCLGLVPRIYSRNTPTLRRGSSYACCPACHTAALPSAIKAYYPLLRVALALH